MGNLPTHVRERLLTAACDLFYREGIQSVGIQRVLQEADAAKASLYSHFPSKDDLIEAYLDRMSGRTQAMLESAMASAPPDPRARVLALFDALEAWRRSPEFRGCPFMNASSELSDPSHRGHAAIARHRRWLHGHLVALVAATGEPEPETLARTLLLLLDGATSAAVIDHTEDSLQLAKRAAERLLPARG